MENQLNNEMIQRIREIRYRMGEAAEKAKRDPNEISLMAVTKTRTPLEVNCAIQAGITLLGENKAQELVQRYDQYDTAEIHFIGQLQTNKVRQIVDKVSMIQSVDSIKLMQEIQKYSALQQKTMDILLEVNIGGEMSKGGVEISQVKTLVRQVSEFPNLHLRGLMTIPPQGNTIDCEKYFYSMQNLFVDIQGEKIDNVTIDILSMGMSGDYPLAIQYGATIVRIGTAIFGHRNAQPRI